MHFDKGRVGSRAAHLDYQPLPRGVTRGTYWGHGMLLTALPFQMIFQPFRLVSNLEIQDPETGP